MAELHYEPRKSGASPWSNLQRAVDCLLISELSTGLKRTLDEMLRDGRSKAEILEEVHVMTGGPAAVHGGLTYMAIEAYLDRSKVAAETVDFEEAAQAELGTASRQRPLEGGPQA
jgi:hypothetical protein